MSEQTRSLAAVRPCSWSTTQIFFWGGGLYGSLERSWYLFNADRSEFEVRSVYLGVVADIGECGITKMKIFSKTYPLRFLFQRKTPSWKRLVRSGKFWRTSNQVRPRPPPRLCWCHLVIMTGLNWHITFPALTEDSNPSPLISFNEALQYFQTTDLGDLLVRNRFISED